MKKDAKTFQEVAERCTKFCPCEKCGCSNESNYSATSKTTGGASDFSSNKSGSNKSSNSTNGSNKSSNSTNGSNKSSNSTSGSNKSSNSSNSSNRATNATSQNVSCKNCSHYDPSKVCSLDLYTEIVENHHL